SSCFVFSLRLRRAPCSPLFPYTTLFRSGGVAAFLVAAVLLALGVGLLLRSTAGSVTVAITVLLLLPGILQFITLDWVQDVIEYRSEEHTSELQSRFDLVCRLLLEKKKAT